MSIIETLNQSDFVYKFRAIRQDNFSREALDKLFDCYDEFGENVEFDPIAICHEWAEYDSREKAEKDYDDNIDEEYIIELPSGGVLIQAH